MIGLMTGSSKGFPYRLSKRFSLQKGNTAWCTRIVTSTAAFAALLVSATSTAHAQSTSLLTNGDFETGTFAGWTVSNVRDASDTGNTRNFYIDTPGTTTPDAGGPYFTSAQNTLPGGGGNFYAVSANNFSGQSVLLQSFTTPTITNGQSLQITLSFDLFVNDQSGWSNMAQDPSGLDYTTGGTFQNNQYARVDLLRSSSSDFSTSASDVLFNVALNVPVNDAPYDNPNPYQRYTVNLSPYVQAGTTYKIRFAEVNNNSALNLGVDNAGIQAEITPEPSTVALTFPFFGLTPVFLVHSRRKAKKG